MLRAEQQTVALHLAYHFRCLAWDQFHLARALHQDGRPATEVNEALQLSGDLFVNERIAGFNADADFLEIQRRAIDQALG